MPGPPNILFMFTDQHQQRILGAYGNDVVRTPRLDALAREGVLFRNAIVAQPVCTPSRASLLTGTYVHTHGCAKNNWVLTTRIPTAAEVLNEHGYRCGYIGKWHCGNELVPQRGFEGFYCPTEDNYASDADRGNGLYSPYDRFLRARGLSPEPSRGHPYFTQRQAAAVPEDLCKPAYMAQQADAFFRGAGAEPFFLVMSFLEPHPPYFGPFDGMYTGEEVGLPANYDVDPAEMAGWSRRHHAFRGFYYDTGHNIKTSDKGDVLGNTARYYGLVSLVDKYVGATLDSLARHGLADNTIVIFTSDHGDMLGSHQMVDKGPMFDESIKVPFILRHPRESFPGTSTGGDKAHAFFDAVVNNVDVLPTLLDVAGLPIPGHVEGHSFLPALRGDKDALPRFGVVEWNGILQNMHARDPHFADVLHAHVRCVVTPRWKLALSPGDRGELYDLESDPLERRNVIESAGNRDVVDELYSYLREWQRDTRDPLAVPHPLKEAWS